MARKKAHPDSEPWERMPGESVKNYGYFCAYRDMRYLPVTSPDEIPKAKSGIENERSLRRIAKQLDRSVRTLSELSSRYNWVMRCDAYDLYILRCQRNKNEDRILKMLADHAAVGEQLWKRGFRRLLSIKDDEIEPADVVKMLDTGVKIERLSRGEITGHSIKSGAEISGETELSGVEINNEVRRNVEEMIHDCEPEQSESGDLFSVE